MLEPSDNSSDELTENPQASGRAREESHRSQLDFEIEFFGRILKRDPDYADVLRVHANNLTAKKMYARGLAVDRRLVQLRPSDPVAHYNLACSYALMRMNDAAIASLDSSLKLGYRDFEHILGDPDLEHLRKDARFVGLIGRYVLKQKQSGKAR